MFVPLSSVAKDSGLKIFFEPNSWHYDGSTLYSALCFYIEPTGKNRGSMVYGSFSVLGDYEGGPARGHLTFTEMLALEEKKTRHHLSAAAKNSLRPYVADHFYHAGAYWDKATSKSFLPLAQQAEKIYPSAMPGFTDWMILV